MLAYFEGALDDMTQLSVNEAKLNCLDGEVGIRRVLVNFGLDFLVSLQVFNIYIYSVVQDHRNK